MKIRATKLTAIASAIQKLLGTFTPQSLFTSGVNGAWYDPSDFSTMFRDAAGTTPVTAVGQPVGLMLDKSKGLVLGPELVANGGFAGVANGTDVTTLPGWAAYGTPTNRYIQSEQLRITTSAGDQGVKLTLSTSAGKRYLLKAAAAGDLGSAGMYSDYTGDISTVGGKVGISFVATGSSSTIYFRAANNSIGTTYYDNISVRELPGNHAFNSSGNSANFPVLSARYNLLTKSEQFDDGSWAKNGVPTPTANQTTAPDGTNTADLLAAESVSGLHYLNRSDISVVSGVTYAFSICLKNGPGANAPDWVQLILNSAGFGTQVAAFNISTGVTGNKTAGIISSSITAAGNGFWQCTVVVTATNTSAASGAGVAFCNNQNIASLQSYTAATGENVYIWGADLRVSNDALNQPAYQRVNTATDYDTVGFKPYLRFNGVNQWLQTSSIDFTYGDKMFVSAGVRKLSDAAIGALLETSANSNTNARAIWLLAPGSPGSNQYSFRSKGTSAADVNVTGYASPITNVVSGVGNISAPASSVRVNGVQVASDTTTSQGTGNYGNYPLYIGARAGSSLFFNGRLYGLVVAGKQASASEIASTEAWLNNKTGAY